MNRILLGAALGAALVYFLDIERGEARRTRASDWASQYINSDTMDQARQAGQATIQQARSLTNQVGNQVNQLRAGRRSSSNSGVSANNATRASASAQI
jgi:hypothetical protein